jgi:hypothetical protein
MTITIIALVSAHPGDLVPGYELADPNRPFIPGLEERGDVQTFLSEQGYGDDPEVLAYLVPGDKVREISDGLDRLIVKIYPAVGVTLARLTQELGARDHEIRAFAGPVWTEMAETLGVDPSEIGSGTELPAEGVTTIREAWVETTTG